MGGAGVGHLESDLEHDLLEECAVFSALDGLGVRADEADIVLLEDVGVDELHGGIQCGLASEGRKQGVGLLPLDDLFDDLGGDRFDVGPARELRIGHDRGRVGVHQHHVVSLFGQRLAGLDARVVELASLSDHDGAGADEEDFLDRGVFGHGQRGDG